MTLSEAKQMAEASGFEGIKKVGNIDGKEVYAPYHSGKGTMYVGFPTYFLVKGDEIEMVSGIESLDIMEKINTPEEIYNG